METSDMELFHPSVDEIQKEYQDGNLEEVEEDLSKFLNDRRDNILETYNNLKDQFPEREIDLVVATKTYIMQIRSINPEYEIQKELNDIREEIQRRQSLEDNDLDRDEIIQEWCDRYAPSWRDRHVMTIIYVFEQNKERYLSILKDE